MIRPEGKIHSANSQVRGLTPHLLTSTVGIRKSETDRKGSLKMYELTARYDNRKSFYGKATVQDGVLYS